MYAIRILSTFEIRVNNYILAANFFQQRKNKRFNYKPRYSEATNDSQKKAFADKWLEAKTSHTKRTKRGISLNILIVLLVLILIGMYVLESKFV